MRLFLLPISTRRTLLYCQRFDATTRRPKSPADWIQERAAKIWADWERQERGWRKKVVGYGNYALRRIPYQEWGLKSVPPLTRMVEMEARVGTDLVDVVWPTSLLSPEHVLLTLLKLATERERHHMKMAAWSIFALPLTTPIALIPVVPNLPFFYLIYRAWSHYQAYSGGKHIQFLMRHDLLAPTPSGALDAVYTVDDEKEDLVSTLRSTVGPEEPQQEIRHPNLVAREAAGGGGEVMLLSQTRGRKMTQALGLPALEVELERAIWQVEQAIKKQNDWLAK